MAGEKKKNKSWLRKGNPCTKLAQQATRVQGSGAQCNSTSPGSSAEAQVQGSSTTMSIQGSSATSRVQGSRRRCAIYTRTSTTSVHGPKTPHQVSQVAQALVQMTEAKVATKDITTINDCTSGMLPAHRRQRLVEVITGGQFQAVVVERTHVLSRKTSEIEDLAAIASEHGVQLIPSESMVDSPVDSFGCRAMMAAMEFQRDMTHKGLMAKSLKMALPLESTKRTAHEL